MFKRINFKNIIKSTNSFNRCKYDTLLGNRLFSTTNSINHNIINNQNEIDLDFNKNNINKFSNNNNQRNINNNNNINQENNESNDGNNGSNNNNSENENNNNNYSNTNNNNNNKDFKDQKEFFQKEFGLQIIKISCIVFLVRTYILEITYCKGTSMEPTIQSGDFIFIDKMSKDYEVGDLITAVSPTSGQFSICKRIRFVEGDRILFESPNGLELYEVPKDYVWIEGDNYETSRDSRNYGAIPKRLITGKVLMRPYPLSFFQEPPPITLTEKIN
ncbi:hypothetical protein ACTA71_008983 [Dictyostelium dimigraforme]